MSYELARYEGRRFCVVFVKVDEAGTGDPANCEIRCLHGRANIEGGHTLRVETADGSFAVPRSCYGRILENDGTSMLRDAEFFVMVKVDREIAWEDDTD